MHELVTLLDLPLGLTDEYINHVSAAVNTLSSDHRTKNSYSRTKFRNRRMAMIVNPNARLLHYDGAHKPQVAHHESENPDKKEEVERKKSRR